MSEIPDRLLEGKAIIVTGAGQGIGAAIARTAAKQGGRILVNDIDAALASAVADDICVCGGEAAAYSADISDWAEGERLVEVCVSRFGSVDGLVNNAGVFRFSTIQDMSPGDMMATFMVNVMGTASCAQAAARHMLAMRKGAIVNIVSGAQMGLRGLGAYGASKGAVASLTYAWAAELADSGVRMNAVSPRAETRMAEMTRIHNAREFSAAKPPFPQPAANAPIVCYLLSDLSADIHGQIVRSDGEALALMTHPAVLAPVVRLAEWTVEAIDRAFTEHFRSRLQGVGIATVECSAVTV